MNNKLAAWIALGLIAIVAAVCLGVTHEVTKDVIRDQTRQAMEAAWRALVPGAEFPDAQAAQEGETPKEYVYAGLIDGEAAGYVAQVAVAGYGGELEIIVGTDKEGTLTGISVGGANFKETAGLGAKAREPKFTDQFVGKTAPLVVGETIDAITAATITSSAVVRGVNTAIERIAEKAGFSVAGTDEAGALGDGRYAATVRGFGGPVYVELTLDDAGIIEAILIGNEEFNETPGYGHKALEAAFFEQFIGKSGHVELGVDIDAISGATITSKAVVDAVNLALLYHDDPEAALTANTRPAFELPEIPEDALTAYASSKGYGGPVGATITVDGAGKTLLMVEFGGEKWAETDGLGSRVLEPAFWHQFIGRELPVDPGLIDTVAGATVTSEAAVTAVNKAYRKLFPEEASAAAPEPAQAQNPNTAKASSRGYGGPVAVTLTVGENNTIAGLVIGGDTFAETKGIGSKALEPAFAEQFIGKALPLHEGDIDVIAGATVTSKAVIAAVNKAYEKLLAQ
ncbi:MAG: FMN-binding protein [Firmicutes bacterium]|nr:FMN-binding protein [Bacillota bacterium]